MTSAQQKQRYDAAFAAALQQLDAHQRRAVEHIEGPVAVIAGPGAGKTQLLAARIGYILTHTDARPQNILCLTFTDAGANALRARLLQFIGPDAHKVHIFTFHSFCNSIIQDNVELFGQRHLEPVSELERIDLVRRLLAELPPEHPLRRSHADPWLYEQQVRELFRWMKTENWPPEYISQAIDNWLADLPQNPRFQYLRNTPRGRKGEPKQAAIQTAVQRMERLRAAALLFPLYEEAMRQSRRYDYDDMIRWVVRAFEQNEYLLRQYQEQYLYFMVDEYQDTNGAQNEVLHLLIRYWEAPDVLIVGDDDQSVYEFQGARLHNLLHFLETYAQSVELIVLPYNYRSSQHIVDAAAGVIEHNQLRVAHHLARLGLEKRITAAHPAVAGLPERPVVMVWPNRLYENAAILHQIETWQAQGVDLQEIAILYARHKQVETLQAMLEQRGIPYQTRRKTDILGLPVTQNLLLLLRYLAAEFERPGSGEHWLFRLLHIHFLGILPEDLSRMALHIAMQEPNMLWRAALSDTRMHRAAGLRQPEAWFALYRRIDNWLHSLANDSLLHFVERVIGQSGLLQWAMSGAGAGLQLDVLRTFMAFAEQETTRHAHLSLARLLEIIDSYQQNGVPIELQRLLESGQGVHLITAHSAKGLEFERVFIIDAVKEEWEPSNRSGGGRFVLPDTLTRSLEEDALEARRRLFYVAMTRAKRWLQVSYSREDHAGKPLQAAIFVDEMLETLQTTPTEGRLPREHVFAAQAALLLEKKPSATAFPAPQAIDALLQSFAMSISALERYLRCPLEFYYQHLLRVPAPSSEYAAYGQALHAAIQRYYERMLADREKAFPDLQTFKYLFEEEMRRRAHLFAAERYSRYLHTGFSRIEGLHAQDDWRAHRQVKVEYAVRRTQVDGIPLTGVIDKVEWHKGQQAIVTDYKTGQPNPQKIAPPTAKNPLGAPYWRQLAFYKLLYESHSLHAHIVTKGAITFLDPDDTGRFQTLEAELIPAQVGELKALIGQTYEKIMRQEFYHGCGRADCLWCNLAQARPTEVEPLAQPDIEALDDNR